MRTMLKTVLPLAAFAVILSQPASASQFGTRGAINQQQQDAEARCRNSGGTLQNGNCVMPQRQQQGGGGGFRGTAQQPQGGGRGGQQQQNAQQPAQQQPAQQQQAQPQQPQQQDGRGGRGNGRGDNGLGQFGNNNNNNGPQFGGRGDNGRGQFGNNNGRGDNRPNGGQFGGNFGGNFGRFDGRRDRDRFDNDRRVFGRDYDRRDFSVRFYGRYGNDPFEFERQRQLYRARQNWRERYAHDYVFADDPFYSECRSDNIVGNTVLGTILGGFVGNVASGGRGDATVAGMIFGGATGAVLSRDLGCEDRYFVYRTYYDGFDRGRPGAEYPWRNPRTGLNGTLIVGDYYRDGDGYRCATYTQEIFVRGRREFDNGHACRQDDGTWVMID